MPSKDRESGVPSRRGYSDSARGNGSGTVRYGAIEAELLRECVDYVTTTGDAVVFALTRDGGAFCVRVLSDAGNGCWYPPTPEALRNTLTNVIDIAKGL